MKIVVSLCLAAFAFTPVAQAAKTIKVKRDNTWPDLKVAIDNTWPDCKIKFDNTWPDVIIQEENTWPDIKVKQDQTWPDIKVKQDQTWPDVVVGGTTDLILAAVACKQRGTSPSPAPSPPPPLPTPAPPSPQPVPAPAPEFAWSYCSAAEGCANPFAYVSNLLTSSRQKTFTLTCRTAGQIAASFFADRGSAARYESRAFALSVSVDGRPSLDLGQVTKKESRDGKFLRFSAASSASSALLTELKRGSKVTVSFMASGETFGRESFVLKGSSWAIGLLDGDCR